MNKYQDALNGLKWVMKELHRGYEISRGENSKWELLQNLIDVHEHCQWHDLRKNPNDKTTNICLCVTYRKPHTYRVEVLLPNCASLENKEELIAWKCLEEFKDE